MKRAPWAVILIVLAVTGAVAAYLIFGPEKAPRLIGELRVLATGSAVEPVAQWHELGGRTATAELTEIALHWDGEERHHASMLVAASDPDAAGALALEAARDPGFDGDGAILGWLVFAGMPDFASSLETGKELLASGNPKVRLAGHVVLCFTTLLPLPPDPSTAGDASATVWSDLPPSLTLTDALAEAMARALAHRDAGLPESRHEKNLHDVVLGPLTRIPLQLGPGSPPLERDAAEIRQRLESAPRPIDFAQVQRAFGIRY